MLRIFIIRHAKSSWDNPALRDFQRPLNERGTTVAPKMAKLMQHLSIVPDLIISSPAKRAIDTAHFFAMELQIPFSDIKQEPALYEANTMDLMRVISQLPETGSTVFLFGHNPGLTELVNRFTDVFIPNIPTCGIIELNSSANNWRSLFEENTKIVNTWFPKTSLEQ